MAALAEHGGQRIALSTGIGAGGPSLWGTRRTVSEASGCPSGEACGQAGSPQAKPPLLVIKIVETLIANYLGKIVTRWKPNWQFMCERFSVLLL